MTGRTARLSIAGIRLAAAGSWADSAAVARWLYRFGTVPHGPAFDRDFGPDDDPMAVLGLTRGGRARRLLESFFDASSLQGWYSFARAAGQAQRPVRCKLYVSPRPEALNEAFPIIAEQFVRSEVRSFKIGRGIEGLLRPDKIIAYFEDRAHMTETAKALEQSLASFPAQGVPFTEEIGADGLLSTGIDPPVGDSAASWRAWVTRRLSACLTAALLDGGTDPVAATLASIRAAGVDTEHWAPTDEAFSISMPQ